MNKKRKIYILAFIVLVVIGSAFLAGKFVTSKGNKEPKSYEAGIIEGNHYKSKWIGLQLEVPQEFHMYTREELDQRMKEAEEEEKNLIMDMCASSNDMGSITINVENCGKSVSNTEEYLQSKRKEMLENNGEVMKFKGDGTISNETIAGQKYNRLKMEYTLDDLEFCTEIYVRMIEDSVVVIQIDYDPAKKSDRDLLFQSFQEF